MHRSSCACARWLVAALLVGVIFMLPTASGLVVPKAVDSSQSEQPVPLGHLGIDTVGWHPSPVTFGGNSSHSPDVAVNPFGNTVVAWITLDGPDGIRGRVLAQHDGLMGVIANDAVSPHGLHVAIDRKGNAFAVWKDWDGSSQRIRANRYALGAGWGTPALIDASEATYGWSSLMIVDAGGDAIVVWENGYNDQNEVWAKRCTEGAGWSTGALTSTNGVGILENSLAVAADASGNLIAVWPQSGMVVANRYDAALGWGSPTSIGQAYNTPCCSDAPVAVDANANGDAVVVWAEDFSTDEGWGSRVWGNRYTVGQGWGRATLLENVSNSLHGRAFSPKVAIDQIGHATAVWTSVRFDPWEISIFADRFEVGAGWATAMPIKTSGKLDALALGRLGPGGPGCLGGVPQVDADWDGNVLVVWSEFDGVRCDVWASRYAAQGDWVTPTVIDASDSISAGEARLAVDASGTATVVWSQYVDPFSRSVRGEVWTSTYIPDRTLLVLDGLGATNAELATLRESIIALLAVQAGLAVSTVTLFLFYWNLRRPPGRGGMSQQPTTQKNSLETDREGTNLREPRPARNAPSSLPARKPWNGWAMTCGPLRLTAKERVLLHLLNYTRFAEASEVPPDLAQAGITTMAGVDSRHFAQYIRPLTREGIVRERTAHVKGNLHRRKVYGLTESGRRTATGIRDRLRSVVVRVQDASGSREATIADVLADAGGSLSILDVVRKSLQDGVVKLRH